MSSCLSLEVKEIKKPEIDIEEKIDITNKRIMLKTSYTDNELTNLSKTKANAFDTLLPKAIAESLAIKYSAQITVATSQDADSFLKTNDAALFIVVAERTVIDESTIQSIFRGFSFGFYRQYLTKEIKYEINYQENGITKVKKSRLTVNSEFGYQAPMLIIPMNLDKHPFSQNQQISFHKDQLLNLFEKLVN